MINDQNFPDHAGIHEHIAAALAGGLTPDEQSRFDTHIHACPDCFDAYTEARDADRAMQRALDGLTPVPPSDHFEDRLITTFREKQMKSAFHPLAKRAGFAIAAAVALAATGVFGQYVTHSDLLNNPLTEKLAEENGMPSIFPSFEFAETRTAATAENKAKAAFAFSAVPMEWGSLSARKMVESDQKSVAENGRQIVTDSVAGFKMYHGSQQQVAGGRGGYVGGQTAPFDIHMVPVGGVAIAGENRYRDDANKSYFQRSFPTDSPNQSSNSFASRGGLEEKEAGKGMNDSFKDDIAAATIPPPAPTHGPELADLPGTASSSNAPTAPATTQPSNAAATEVAERKIIRNGNVEFEVRSFDDAFATISSVVGEEGGFVSSTSSDKLANGKVRGSITVRVPPEHLDRLLLKLRALGELKSQQIGANDITKEYTDLESELRALRAMESRLIDIIKTANGQVKDLVVAEKQLGEYRIRIEKIEGEIRYYNNLVGMATLTITAYEKDIQTPTAAQEQENISLNLETEDVETRYSDARKVIEDAKGRVVESELKKHDAGQYAAQIVAEVPPEKADFVAAQLKQLGTVAAFNRDRKQTTTGGNGAPTVQVEQKPTRFSLSIYNLANIAPRETSVITIAVRDVEEAYKTVLATVQRTPDDMKLRDFQPKPIGRIITSNLTGQQPDQMTADIRADVTSADADNVLQALRSLGEVMASSISENPDAANVTAAKRGVQIRLVSVAAVPARESRSLSTVAAQVPDAYTKLIAALQTLESAGTAHILTSQLNQTDPRTINATLAFDARRDALPAIDKAFADSGIDILSRNVARSTDTANTLDTKVHFEIDELKSADALPPERTTTLGIETDNIEKSMQNLRAQLDKDGITHIQYNIDKEASGRTTAHLIADVPLAASTALLAEIHDIGGDEKVNQVVDDPQVPPTRFAKERIDLTLSSRESIVANDRGLASTIRAALGSAVAALLWSLYLIVTGILLIGPWLLIAWIAWKLMKRNVASRRQPGA